MDEFQELSTVEEVNNSLRYKYKQQKKLINNLGLVFVFWSLMMVLGVMVFKDTKEHLDQLMFFGGISILPVVIILIKKIADIRLLNKHIETLNLQKDIFTEQVSGKSNSQYKDSLRSNYQKQMQQENRIGMVDIKRD